MEKKKFKEDVIRTKSVFRGLEGEVLREYNQ